MENVYPQRKLSKGVSCNVMDLKPLKKHPCTFAAVCVFSATQAFESIYHGGKKSSAIAYVLCPFSKQFCNISVKLLLSCNKQLSDLELNITCSN